MQMWMWVTVYVFQVENIIHILIISNFFFGID